MRGRQVFFDSLVNRGVRLIFGNPGTTESPLLDALVDFPDLRYITTLHEGIAVTAAAFYAQASGEVPLVNLHVAPGLGNAVGALYGALKANSPIVVTAGQQDTRLRLRDPILGHDLVAMAAPVTKLALQVERADEMALVMHRAFKVALDPPMGPVFVSLPIDVMEQETEVAAFPAPVLDRLGSPDPGALAEVVRLLIGARNPAILAGDGVVHQGAFDALLAFAECLGASVWSEGLLQHTVFPLSHPQFRGRIPFDAPSLARTFADHDLVVFVGGAQFEEVWYAPGSCLPAQCAVIELDSAASRLGQYRAPQAGLAGNLNAVLTLICDRLTAAAADFRQSAADRRQRLRAMSQAARDASLARHRGIRDRLPMPPARVLEEIAACAPANLVIVDESLTAQADVGRQLLIDRPHHYYAGRGGGIGQGLAGAIGVQLAHAGQPVLCLSGDGSAMYSVQSLWTAAHEGLPIVFVILANREYRILKHNLDQYRSRFQVPSNKPYPHMNLDQPALDFVAMAQGMGVDARRAETPDEFARALRDALSAQRPSLIEVRIAGKESL